MKQEMAWPLHHGMGPGVLRAGTLAAALLGLLGGCAQTPGVSTAGAAGSPAPAVVQACAAPAARAALAPGGALRVGVYRGSPTSYLESKPGEPSGGVGWLLGRALAQQLGVGFEPVVLPNNAAVLAAAQQGKADLVFTNATPARARVLHFAVPVMDVEKSVLLPPNSAVASLGALRGRAVRIGVSAGSSTGSELAEVYPAATLVPVPTLQQAAQMLAQGRLDGFATNKAILFELAGKVPASRVLPGHWGLEHFALGVPAGRDAGSACLQAFSTDAARAGLLQEAIGESRLQGALVAQQ